MRPKEIYQITFLNFNLAAHPNNSSTSFLFAEPPIHHSITKTDPASVLFCWYISALNLSTQQSLNFITNENFISTFCVSVFQSIKKGHKSKLAQFSFIITMGNLELHFSHPHLTNGFLLYPVPVTNQWQTSNIVLHLGFINSLHGKIQLDAYASYKAMQHILHSHRWMESGHLARSGPNTATVSDVLYML